MGIRHALRNERQNVPNLSERCAVGRDVLSSRSDGRLCVLLWLVHSWPSSIDFIVVLVVSLGYMACSPCCRKVYIVLNRAETSLTSNRQVAHRRPSQVGFQPQSMFE